MGVTLCRLHFGMSEQSAGNRQALTAHNGPRGVGVAEVVQTIAVQLCQLSDSSPAIIQGVTDHGTFLVFCRGKYER